MINPYKNVNWDEQIPSISHAHCENDDELQKLYNGGVRFAPVSNYYPSSPWYPLKNFYQNVPEDMFGAPNAEHHNFYIEGKVISAVHLNSIGSTFSSGNPPGVAPTGAQIPWQEFVDKVKNNLIYKDCGGITINHPMYTKAHSKLSDSDFEKLATQMLQYENDIVLGIEIFNANYKDSQGTIVGEMNLELWDNILSKGIRCWGFSVPDHNNQSSISIFNGLNILLAKKNIYDCLKAYRDGAFYGKKSNIAYSDLAFNRIEMIDNRLFVSTNNPEAQIKIVCNGKEYQYQNGFVIPESAVYVRCEAKALNNKITNGEYDIIWSNPIIFQPYRKNHNISKRFFLYY